MFEKTDKHPETSNDMVKGAYDVEVDLETAEVQVAEVIIGL